MSTLGDFDTSAVIYGKFTTYRPSTGAPYTLAGTPALSVYKDNSTTQSTAGVTLTADFDSVTGLNHFAIDTSADGTFYSAGSFFDIVITTGTVDSVSAVGTVVGRFTIRKNSALKPATAGRTIAVDASGLADANVVNAAGTAWNSGAITGPTLAANTGIKPARTGTAQAGASGSLTLDASASAETDIYVGMTLFLTGGTGAGQARTILGYNGTTKVATVDTAWVKTPDATTTFAVVSRSDPVNVSGSITGDLLGNVIGSVDSITDPTSVKSAVLTSALTESYASDGAAPTLAQFMFMLWAKAAEMTISGTTMTVKKLDASTTAMTFTLNDATTPTSITRSS